MEKNGFEKNADDVTIRAFRLRRRNRTCRGNFSGGKKNGRRAVLDVIKRWISWFSML
jgi:hypothetical protein